MKIIITESQYNKLISSLTGEPLTDNKSFFSKILKYFKTDSNIGIMILNSIKNGNYTFDGYDVSNYDGYKFKFEIKGFPFILTKEKTIFHIKYTLFAPMIQDNMEITEKVGNEIVDQLAMKHMDNYDYFDMITYFDM